MHTACVWCGAFVYCLQVPLFPEPGAVSLMRQYRNRFLLERRPYQTHPKKTRHHKIKPMRAPKNAQDAAVCI